MTYWYEKLQQEKAYMIDDTPISRTIKLAMSEQIVANIDAEMPKVQPGDWLNSLSSTERKECAMSRGVLNYFPDALAIVSRHSVRMNEKHNPGQPVHWSRGKSADHDDCVVRHSASIAVDPDSVDGDGAYHIVCRAWRALAALQVWIEEHHQRGDKL